MTATANTLLELETIKWDNITNYDILVKEYYDDMTGLYQKTMIEYYIMTKKNDKSAWLTRCNENGKVLGIKAERFPRNKVPRRKVKGKLSQYWSPPDPEW
jgi:hypothetical protein